MNESPPTSLGWRYGLLLFLAVLILALPQAALLPLLDRDEPRFAEASREMLESGEFVVPTFNHEPRYAKPPLIYWCQAASFIVLGENAFAARLPSLLATAGTAWLIAVWGARLGSAAVGLGAALSYALCLQTVQQGRVATADALLIFFMNVTAFAGWCLLTQPPASHSTRSYLWDSLLAFGFAGGFLAKGPEAFLPLFPLLYCARKNHRLAAEIVVNFLIGVAIVLFWALPAYVKTHGDYWRQGLSEGVGQRMVSGLQGHGASGLGSYLLLLPYYLVLFWLGALPWSPFLLIHRRKLFAGWKIDLADTYLLLNAALIFLVFTLMVTKLPHYTLPAFPFLALLFIRRWQSVQLSPGIFMKWSGMAGVILAVLTLIAVPIALANHATPSPVGELVRQAKADLKPGTQFALVDFQEPSAVWEMRGVSQNSAQFISEKDRSDFLALVGPRAVIYSSKLTPLRWSGLSTYKLFAARGFDSAKGNRVDLEMVVKP